MLLLLAPILIIILGVYLKKTMSLEDKKFHTLMIIMLVSTYLSFISFVVLIHFALKNQKSYYDTNPQVNPFLNSKSWIGVFILFDFGYVVQII